LYDVYTATTGGDGHYKIENVDDTVRTVELEVKAVGLTTGRQAVPASSAIQNLVALPLGGAIQVATSDPYEVVIRSTTAVSMRIRPWQITERRYLSEDLPIGDYQVSLRSRPSQAVVVRLLGGPIVQVTLP
jgi:hypothetical protein